MLRFLLPLFLGALPAFAGLELKSADGARREFAFDGRKWGRFSRINITLRFSKVVDRFDTSRPEQSTDVVGSATVFASMRYLGLGTLIELTYDGASDLKLTYQNGGTGTAGGKQWWRVRAEPSDMESLW